MVLAKPMQVFKAPCVSLFVDICVASLRFFFLFYRVAREKKESRRRLAEKITPRKSRKVETFEDIEEEEEDPEALANKGFLSKNIIDFLAQREK